MERMIIKEFKDKSNIEIIESIMKMNNGYVTSKKLSNLGIHRMYLNIMKERGMIEKVGNGIYIDSNRTSKCSLLTHDCTLFSWTFYQSAKW